MTEAFHTPQEVLDGSLSDLEAACLTATYNSMRLISQAQRLKGFVQYESTIKHDGSLLTDTDLTSERLAQEIFAVMLPGSAFGGEEGSETAGQAGAVRIGFDPVDGTRALAVGAPTSTTICTVYDAGGRVLGAVIGEPSTGRCLSAFEDQQTQARLFDMHTGETLAKATRLRTWQGELANKGQVFIDNNRPHKHNGHSTLLGSQHDALRRTLREQNIGVMELGSNGAHQLYVASGADRAAAAITTARGNPEDTAAGAFLVERSGGAVQRFYAIDGRFDFAELESPEYDLLVAANNQRTLRAIGGILLESSL